ncbi:hypothetical protein AVEN_158300-1 [Araneus ventricosus]|uniref:Uncharacterized protein n=1 Tax=Araneus ventricosus TaxID=182803 RepID=A0A4Y2IGP4_ARAVE|nr:hypothetical protein AVEN_158300-1 [Araneus ventricosus]
MTVVGAEVSPLGGKLFTQPDIILQPSLIPSSRAATGKSFFLWWGVVVPDQVSPSSSDRGSKWRDSSQNNQHSASKRDFILTKLTNLEECC